MGFLIANWKWVVSAVALIVYVAVQHALYMSLIKACREFEEALDTDGAGPATGTPGGFGWLKNIRAMFTRVGGGWVDNSPLPREAVIDSLNNEIWRTSRYLALQRWGLAAPLIGVILSALGFMVSPPELNGEVSDIMGKLGPLFVGVFVGALMAIVNQVYLHFSAVRLGQVRAKAVRWFDEVVWSSIRQNAHNVLGQAAAETQSAAKSLETSSRQLATCNVTYRDSLLELNQQLAQVRNAAQSTSTSFDTFTSMVAQLTERLGLSVRNLNILNETAAAVGNAGAVWNVAAAKLNYASTAIEDSARNLHETCGNLRLGIDDSAGGLLDAVKRLTEPISRLEGSIEHMQTNTEKHAELSAALTAAVSQSNQFLDERMALNIDEATRQDEMATRTRGAVESLKQLTETVGPIKETGASLNVAASGLKDASATIETALKGLLETCNGFSAHCAKLQSSMTIEVSDATTDLQNAARDLAHPVAQLHTSVSGVAAASDQHAELTARLEAIAKLGERFLQEREKANADEAVRVDRVNAVEKRLQETAGIVSESAGTMRQLHQDLDALVNELRMARENGNRGGWLSWLSPRAKDNRN